MYLFQTKGKKKIKFTLSCLTADMQFSSKDFKPIMVCHCQLFVMGMAVRRTTQVYTSGPTPFFFVDF